MARILGNENRGGFGIEVRILAKIGVVVFSHGDK